LLALALVAPAAAQLAESGSFRLSQATFGGGGTPATSGSFILGHTTGQDSVVGEAGSASFLLQSGFWTSASVNRVLTLAAAGSGEGALSGEFFACDAAAGAVIGDCEEVAVHGSSLAVTAAPQPGSFFTGWSGCDLLSTNSLPEDTCLVVLSRDVTATAEFVAAGGLAGRVWLDHDGNGLEDAGEPGVPGVDVSLSGGAVVATITDANGEYAFDGLFPQSYTVAIDPADLPAGTQPTFDVDGTATPHEAAVIAPTAQQLADVDFGVQPLADLELTMFAEHLNEETVRFTVTVTNLGPSDASGVVATTDLQPANSDVSSTGCAEDPAGIPNCSLGSIAAGESADFIFDVTARGGNSVELVATVTADAVESDPVAANNGASRGSVVVFPIPVLGLPGLVVLLVLVLAMAWWPPVRRAAGSR
jgi:uncharacterized repeat protein (TIGR01451 family)